MQVRFHRLSSWPQGRDQTPEDDRKSAPFKVGWGQTLQDLERELIHLEAQDVVIQVDVDESRIRLDGWLRDDARPRSPAVIISATTRYGPMQWACDICRRWQHNVRAIGLTLERLRLADLYGVTSRGEQYQGWRQLPAAIELVEFDSADHARRWLGKLVVLPPRTPLRTLYLEAAKIAHPDKGGSADLMAKVNRAKSYIEAAEGPEPERST